MGTVPMKTDVNLTVVTLLLSLAAAQPPPSSYQNHTVGGSAGWFFNATTNTSAANYSSWAASQSFNLGDYLIFNTNTNATVIQTYNETTYQSCVTDDSLDSDTFVYNGGSNDFDKALTVAVPLTIVGRNFYFSDGDDGVQCQRGMAFEIVVNHGRGLPPSLNQPPPPPSIEPPGPDSAQPPPITVNGGSPSLENGAWRDVDRWLVGITAMTLAIAVLFG